VQQLENIPWWNKNILKGGGGQKYNKYNKINYNSENFRETRLLPGKAFTPCPSSCGPAEKYRLVYFQGLRPSVSLHSFSEFFILEWIDTSIDCP